MPPEIVGVGFYARPKFGPGGGFGGPGVFLLVPRLAVAVPLLLFVLKPPLGPPKLYYYGGVPREDFEVGNPILRSEMKENGLQRGK